MESEDGASIIKANARRKVSSTFVSQRKPRATGNAMVAGRNSVGGGGPVVRTPGGPADIRGTQVNPDTVLLPGVAAQLTRDALDRDGKVDVSLARTLPAATITIGESTNDRVDTSPSIPTSFGGVEPTYCLDASVTNLNSLPEDEDGNGIPDDEEEQEGFGFQCLPNENGLGNSCQRVAIDDAVGGATNFIYPTLADCLASGCEITVTYDCIDDAGGNPVCTPVVGEGGQYGSLAECEQQCEPPTEPAVPGQCTCVGYSVTDVTVISVDGSEQFFTDFQSYGPITLFLDFPLGEGAGFNALKVRHRDFFPGAGCGADITEDTRAVAPAAANLKFVSVTATITRIDGQPDDCPIAPMN